MIDCQAIRKRWEAVGSKLDERGRRVFAAGEVRAAGWGGLEAVSEITGLARSTIGRGLKDLDAAPLPKGRVRRKGGGRRALSSWDPTLIDDLRRIVEPATLGCPVRPLLWVSKSHDKLAVALQRMGHRISANSVRRLLPGLGYSRQSNRKADEGSKHPDRDAQFEHINAKVIAAQAADQPVISVDTKKKELIGNYRNGGTDGIIALGLGAGKTAAEIRDLYLHRGPHIFPPIWDNVFGRAWKLFRNNVLNIGFNRYDRFALERELQEFLGKKLFGESKVAARHPGIRRQG